MDVAEDPRVSIREICGVTHIGSTGIEWICIREPHDKLYRRRPGHKKGRAENFLSNNPQVEQHYMVPRYPFRVHQEEEWQKEKE